jgi:hypothetical protein
MQNNTDVSPNFFLRQVPPLQATVWQRRKEPVKALRVATIADAAPAATLTEPSRFRPLQKAMKRRHSPKEIWFGRSSDSNANSPLNGQQRSTNVPFPTTSNAARNGAISRRNAAPHRKNVAQRNRSDSPYQERTIQRDNPALQLIKQAVD